MSEQYVEGSASAWTPAHVRMPRRVTVTIIGKLTAKYFGISYEELIGPRRFRPIVRPRQLAMYLAKEFTPASYPEIARRFGGRDHTTAMHAWRVIPGIMERDPQLYADCQMIKEAISRWVETGVTFTGDGL